MGNDLKTPVGQAYQSLLDTHYAQAGTPESLAQGLQELLTQAEETGQLESEEVSKLGDLLNEVKAGTATADEFVVELARYGDNGAFKPGARPFANGDQLVGDVKDITLAQLEKAKASPSLSDAERQALTTQVNAVTALWEESMKSGGLSRVPSFLRPILPDDYDKVAEGLSAASAQTATAFNTARTHEAAAAEAERLKAPPRIDVPIINQLPDLPTGCETVSLTMLMQHAGIPADKMTLAAQVMEGAVPYFIGDGQHGNPNDAFVGNIYGTDGYAMFHGPAMELLSRPEYAGARARDLTSPDLSFDQLLKDEVGQGRPVWIITNSTWDAQDESKRETWDTPSGPVDIFHKEHSVVITGYDEDTVYINDPQDGTKDKPLDREAFKRAWEQMGHQAIVIGP